MRLNWFDSLNVNETLCAKSAKKTRTLHYSAVFRVNQGDLDIETRLLWIFPCLALGLGFKIYLFSPSSKLDLTPFSWKKENALLVGGQKQQV